MRDKRRAIGWTCTAIAVAAPTLLLASLFPPALMLADTTAAGGDLGSHNYAAAWLRTLLLTEFRITGWVPGNYAGFPLFQMYFPLPFVLMVVASLPVGLNVAFKLTSVLGIIGLPTVVFLLLRRLRVPFPGPAIGASLVVLFLFQDGNTMWGGNIASTLAGEFTYSISLLLACAYFAVHDAAMTRRRAAAAAAVIVALLSLTHAYTVLWVAIVAGLAVVTQHGSRLGRFILVFAWGGALCAFWLLPLILYAPWTTAFRHLWVISSITEVLPPPLWPVVVVAIAGPIFLRVRGGELWLAFRRSAFLPAVGAVAALAAYLAAPSFGIVDIRFLPFLQLSLCLIAAAAAGHVVSRWPAPVFSVPITLLGVVLLVQGEHARMSSWARWNYEGYERKVLWPVYRQISEHLGGNFTDPRVAYEHSPDHEALGTIRAFENLPLFSGRSTLEGVNMQASVTSPFVFFVQSEISEVMSCPFPEWGCSRPDLAAGVDHLRLLHVSDVILRSDSMKAAAAALPALRHRTSVGPYEIHTIAETSGGYVVPLAHAPYAVVSGEWKTDAYRWFKRARSSDPLPVFVDDSNLAATVPFAGVFDSLPDTPPLLPLSSSSSPVETVEAERIVVTGLTPRQPVLIRVSYHPRWKTTTGERVWLAGPGFMLVFPESGRLELVYGSSAITTAGLATSVVALLLVVLAFAGLPRRLWRPDQDRQVAPPASGSRLPQRLLTGAATTAILLAVAAGVYARRTDADAVYRRGQREIDSADPGAALQTFRRARDLAPLSNTAIHATYFEAIVLYREERWGEAGQVFQRLVDEFPEAHAAAESLYHVGLCASRIGDTARARQAFDETMRRWPETMWAASAKARLEEVAGAAELPLPQM